MIVASAYMASLVSVASAAMAQQHVMMYKQSTTPQYFQTTPELYANPTPTGKPAFLAQTNPAPFASVSYIPPQPLETQVPISGSPTGGNIYQLMGSLSPYFASIEGFGVEEYPLPEGANIIQIHMIHRHGARYPTARSSVVDKLSNNSFEASGPLSFLNNWTYKLGRNILVPVGRQQLFDSGIRHQYSYGHLYPNDGQNIIVRSTTDDRMIKSAEYFLAGFFGLDWPRNATLEVLIDQTFSNFNNSLSGYWACNNSLAPALNGGRTGSQTWAEIYLQDATTRLNQYIQFKDPSIKLTTSDIRTLQSYCPYETVALGYSAFCGLFTYEEWEGFEYAYDIEFQGDGGFSSPTGRAVGIGWVQEFLARLRKQYLTSDGGSANTTLDSMPSTFPLNQSIYFDFSHDRNIVSVMTAFGLKQFSEFLPATHILSNRTYIMSHIMPFAGHLDIEIIETPYPLDEKRPAKYIEQKNSGDSAVTTYIHFNLNQRTIPLGASFEQCGARDDGWCEMGDFLAAMEDVYDLSMYEEACFGNYSNLPYGSVRNGNPSTSQIPGNTQYL